MGRLAYFQLIVFSAGTYFAFPVAALQSTSTVFSGVGIFKTTFVAASFMLKLAFTVTEYVTWDVPISVMTGIIFRGNLTFEVDRYLCIRISVDCRAGTTNETSVLHELKLSVRGNKCNGSSLIEFIESDALMKSAIVQLHCISSLALFTFVNH